MRLGVDASNIRDGGGVTHIREILSSADPPAHGFSRVIVWGSHGTLERLPRRPWLIPACQSALDGPLVHRVNWQRFTLPRLASEEATLLWVPGGNLWAEFRPFVAMCRNMLVFEPSERRRYGFSWMRFRLELLAKTQARTFRKADGVIFLTDYARKRVIETLGGVPGALATIPHGVDDRFRTPPRTQRPLEEFSRSAPFKISVISVIDVYKHPWIIAEAAARLRAKDMPIAVDFVGPAYGPALKRLSAVLGRVDPAGGALRLVGRVPFEDLHTWYRSADAFVFASSCENMPNILLEAMASGLPIACSNRGPMPEILGEGGVYFDPEDSESAARAIERLARDAALRARVAAEAYRLAQAYRWDTCARETMDFLADVAQAHRAGG